VAASPTILYGCHCQSVCKVVHASAVCFVSGRESEAFWKVESIKDCF
jgi:hypothetical protein